MTYKRLLELAEYGAWERVVAADAKYHFAFMQSMRHSTVDATELDRLESDLDTALEDHAAVRLLIDSLKSF